MTKTFGRYSPTRRFEELRALLNSTGGATIYEISERLGVSVRTGIRYLKALEDSGERLYDERDGHRKVWRIVPSARQGTLQLSTSQMISLYLSKRVFDFLEGTGFKEDLDEIFRQLEVSLKRKDFVAVKNLERKLWDVNEAPYSYEGRIEHVNDIITALIREDRLTVTHNSVGRGKKSFILEPYTLLVYKKGLYLAGFSHHHQGVRTFALDGFKEIDWQKGEHFEYPADYDPSQLISGAFGLIGGPRTRVRILFSEKVARYVRRRRWHPSQKLSRVEGGVILELEVEGTVELVSWVLGFGDQAEVLEPESLRAQLAAEVARTLERYRPRERRPRSATGAKPRPEPQPFEA